MFKGFGQQKEPSIETVCKTMLESYEEVKGLLSCAEDDGKASRLLAQAVVRFADGKQEKHIKFGRIFVANAIQRIVEMLDVNYAQYNDYYKLLIAVTMLVEMDKETIVAL